MQVLFRNWLKSSSLALLWIARLRLVHLRYPVVSWKLWTSAVMGWSCCVFRLGWSAVDILLEGVLQS